MNQIAKEYWNQPIQAPGLTGRSKSGAAIVISDSNHRISWISSHFTRMTGYSLDEIRGKSPFGVLHGPATDADVQKHLESCLENGHEFESDILNYHKDGTTFWVHLVVNFIRNERGAITHVVGIRTDITEHKLEQTAAEIGRDHWNVSLEDQRDGVWDANLVTGAVHFSLRWKQMLGYEEQEISDMPAEWVSRVHPEDLVPTIRVFRKHENGKSETFSRNYRMRCKGGNYKWVLVRGIIASRNADGSAARVIGTHTDITEARQQEQAQADQVARQRNVLVREVHHRIKNSLQGVAGLLRQHAMAQPEMAAPLEKAIAQVRAVAVVHGLEGQAINNEVVLCEMVSSIAGIVEQIVQPGCSVEVRVSVPERIRVDEQERVPLALILNELIMNAAKHSLAQTGSAAVQVAVVWNAIDEAAHIKVRNHGTLPPQFDFFGGQGIGTGLELVRSMLSPRGAKLSFHSYDNVVETRLILSPPAIYSLRKPARTG